VFKFCQDLSDIRVILHYTEYNDKRLKEQHMTKKSDTGIETTVGKLNNVKPAEVKTSTSNVDK
jgi:hypothetical protein